MKRHRFVTWLRGNVPGLAWLPKATDCGDHEPYVESDYLIACYHCRRLWLQSPAISWAADES